MTRKDMMTTRVVPVTRRLTGLLLTLVLLLSGCALSFGYRHADWLITRQLDHYLDLTSGQRRIVNGQRLIRGGHRVVAEREAPAFKGRAEAHRADAEDGVELEVPADDGVVELGELYT